MEFVQVEKPAMCVFIYIAVWDKNLKLLDS